MTDPDNDFSLVEGNWNKILRPADVGREKNKKEKLREMAPVIFIESEYFGRKNMSEERKADMAMYILFLCLSYFQLIGGLVICRIK